MADAAVLAAAVAAQLDYFITGDNHFLENFPFWLAASTTKDENVIPAPEPESRVRSSASASDGLDSRLRGNDNAGIFEVILAS